MYSVPHNWFCGSRVDLYVAFPYGFQYTPRVERRLVKGRIAMNSADT
jgi:hypothetical protein